MAVLHCLQHADTRYHGSPNPAERNGYPDSPHLDTTWQTKILTAYDTGFFLQLDEICYPLPIASSWDMLVRKACFGIGRNTLILVITAHPTCLNVIDFGS